MERTYNPAEIEKKWQKIWAENKAFCASDDYTKPKFYPLVEFPYPSGQGLHVGHPRPYTALDIVARKRRMEGYNVLYPMGWDAFGLPTENFAIKNHIHPRIVTEQNVKRFKEQLCSLGYSFDWDREINTTDPSYYQWTQWIFLKLFNAGLAYKSEMPINWCPSCKCGLANEEVVGGKCERCGAEVIRRVKAQWMLRITDYAEKLINGLEDVDYVEKIKTSQINWIGRSNGAEVDFAIAGKEEKLKIYTTRPDTMFGATYMVISPEHPYIDLWKDSIQNYDALLSYRNESAKKSEFERTELEKEKTGVEILGIRAINPVTQKEIPIYVSDYVLMTYGTGAIMAVPAHDDRDYAFAKKFSIPMVEVIKGGDITKEAYTDTENGVLINSGFLDGLTVSEAKKKIIDFLTEKQIGKEKVNYRLRDWVFSRQRYWGEPIPIVHCDTCGYVPLPESELPLVLPDVESYEPTDNGESPLSKMTEWVHTTCPKCGKPALRETDTMPQWAGSSWYYIRYIDPHCKTGIASEEALKYWLPVDWYNGGMEHTTLHLLYSRFWNHFLYDEGIIPNPEPYKRRTSHGMILGENGEKMSKSRGNVVNPDDIVRDFGADTLRTYEMFIGAFELSASWSLEGVRGCRKFLERVWKLQDMLEDTEGYSEDMEVLMHKTIKKVSNDFESLKFNTAIAQLMTLVNEFYKKGSIRRDELGTILLLLNPVAPHMTEEMNERLKLFKNFLYKSSWPVYNDEKAIEDFVEIAIQINGKTRATVSLSRNAESEEAIRKAKEVLGDKISSMQIKKEIYVPGRIINIVGIL